MPEAKPERTPKTGASRASGAAAKAAGAGAHKAPEFGIKRQEAEPGGLQVASFREAAEMGLLGWGSLSKPGVASVLEVDIEPRV